MTDTIPAEQRRALALDEIAEIVGGSVAIDGDVRVRDIRPLDEAEADQMGFLATKRYVRYLASSRAGALLVSRDLADFVPADRPHVVVEDAHVGLQKLLSHLHPSTTPPAGVHPTAVLGQGVALEDDVGIGPYAVLGDGARVGKGTRLGAHVVVGARSRIGRDCTLHPHVTLYEDTLVGDRVTVHSGARLGSDGFGYVQADGAHQKIPQVGRCVVGDDVEIGANTCVDRGSLGDTVVAAGVKLDNLVQVAHNVRLGPQTLMAALSGIAGSTRVGEGVWIGGQVGVVNHLQVGDGAQVAFGSIVYRDVGPRETVSGHPARPHREELKVRAHAARLPGLVERVKELERTVARLGEAP
jgi:UDP-3-O-[3-hydroxymyristoyl] glucosamine N-acyltransferase